MERDHGALPSTIGPCPHAPWRDKQRRHFITALAGGSLFLPLSLSLTSLGGAGSVVLFVTMPSRLPTNPPRCGIPFAAITVVQGGGPWRIIETLFAILLLRVYAINSVPAEPMWTSPSQSRPAGLGPALQAPHRSLAHDPHS